MLEEEEARLFPVFVLHSQDRALFPRAIPTRRVNQQRRTRSQSLLASPALAASAALETSVHTRTLNALMNHAEDELRRLESQGRVDEFQNADKFNTATDDEFDLYQPPLVSSSNGSLPSDFNPRISDEEDAVPRKTSTKNTPKTAESGKDPAKLSALPKKKLAASASKSAPKQKLPQNTSDPEGCCPGAYRRWTFADSSDPGEDEKEQKKRGRPKKQAQLAEDGDKDKGAAQDLLSALETADDGRVKVLGVPSMEASSSSANNRQQTNSLESAQIL